MDKPVDVEDQDSAEADLVGLGPPDQGMFRLPYLEIRGPAAKASDNFEELCCELAIVVEALPPWTHPYGRSGQRQAGIDIRGETPARTVLALQCKLEQPPTRSKAKVAKLKEWVAAYAAGHDRHRADRLIICVPWPADTGVVDYLEEVRRIHRSDPAAQQFDVEIWNQIVLDRLSAAHPEIVRRFFGKAYARDAESLNARRLAAAVRMGVDHYFDLTNLRSNAEAASDERPKEAADLWADLAKQYRLFGFAGMASNSELRLIEALRTAYGDEVASESGFALASRALDDLETSKAQMRLASFQLHGEAMIALRVFVVNELTRLLRGGPTDESDRLENAISDLSRGARTDTRLVPVLLVLGEVGLCRRDRDVVARAARSLEPVLSELRGSTEYARAVALMADASVRPWADEDLEKSSDVGRIVLWARQGRRLALAGKPNDALDAYGNAELAALGAGLEGPAQLARETMVALRQWLPTTEKVKDLVAGLMADAELAGSYDRRFGDFPDSGHRAGRAGLVALRSSGAASAGQALELAFGALLLSIRGGFIAEEVSRHRDLAAIAERQANWELGVHHAVPAGDADLAESLAARMRSYVDVEESLAAELHNEAKAACAAVAAMGGYAPPERASEIRASVMAQTKRARGMPPFLPQFAIEAVATLASFPMPGSDWGEHKALLEACGGDATRKILQSASTIARWLYRWSGDEEHRRQIDDILIAACVGDARHPEVASRRHEFQNLLIERCGRYPAGSSDAVRHWKDRVGDDLLGVDRSTAQSTSADDELERLLSVAPNENPNRQIAYVVPGFHVASAKSWEPAERLGVVEALLRLASSPLDTSFTRWSALQRIEDTAIYVPLDAADRANLVPRLVELSETVLRSIPPGDTTHLWARGIEAAAALASSEESSLLLDPVSELLFSGDPVLSRVGAYAVRSLAVNGVSLFSASQLLRHSSPEVRSAGVAVVVHGNHVQRKHVERLARDPEPSVRLSLAMELPRLQAIDPHFGLEIGQLLRQDTHAVVRWQAADAMPSLST